MQYIYVATCSTTAPKSQFLVLCLSLLLSPQFPDMLQDFVQAPAVGALLV